jgi:predicted CXXCH cytochrome family protein
MAAHRDPSSDQRDAGQRVVVRGRVTPSPITGVLSPFGRVVAWVAVLVAVVAVAAQAGGCNPRRHYRTLSFFFDGVPDPNAPPPGSAAAAAAAAGRARPGVRPSFVHAPFARNECTTCHVNANDIFADNPVRPDACDSCHAGVKTAHPVMHGPVVIDACTMCHQPHQSLNPHLLRRKSPDVCRQCHESGTLGPTPAAHEDPAADCLSCHSGHGGTDHRLLRVIAPEAGGPGAETGAAAPPPVAGGGAAP